MPEESTNVGRPAARGTFLQGLQVQRRRRALTQRELAELAGLNPTTVSELEVCRRGAYPATMRRLADALDIEVQDLIGE